MEFVLELVSEFEELEVLALVKEECVGGNGLGGGGATVLAGAIVTSLGRGAVLIGASLIGFGSFGAVGGGPKKRWFFSTSIRTRWYLAMTDSSTRSSRTGTSMK